MVHGDEVRSHFLRASGYHILDVLDIDARVLADEPFLEVVRTDFHLSFTENKEKQEVEISVPHPFVMQHHPGLVRNVVAGIRELLTTMFVIGERDFDEEFGNYAAPRHVDGQGTGKDAALETRVGKKA